MTVVFPLLRARWFPVLVEKSRAFGESATFLSQLVLRYRRDRGAERSGSMGGVGLGFADHPPAADPPDPTYRIDSAAVSLVGCVYVMWMNVATLGVPSAVMAKSR